MRRTVCCLWMLALSLVPWTAADSEFCSRPANMDLCWWRNNLYKRYLRFGRGDPFLRFGRSNPESWRYNPFSHLGKRDAEPEALENYLENGGYLRFGRSVSPQSLPTPLLELLASPSVGSRKKRDVSGATSSTDMERTARDVKDGGFLRFGRTNVLTNNDQDSATSQTKGMPAKKANAIAGEEYLRFGRAHVEGFPGFGKRTYLRFGRTSPEGYLRFGKRSVDTD